MMVRARILHLCNARKDERTPYAVRGVARGRRYQLNPFHETTVAQPAVDSSSSAAVESLYPSVLP